MPISTFTTSIEQLYKVFTRVARPHHIDACPCCLLDTEVIVLLSTPLRDLTSTELASYASSVMLTVGSTDDLRYFLPRILEIVVTEPSWWPSVEVVFRTLERANWQRWNTDEVIAVTTFAQTVFAHLLEQGVPNGAILDSWVCAVGQAQLNLEPFLHQIQAPSVRHKLVEYYELNSAALLKGKLSNSFWDGAPTAMRLVVAWFQSPVIQQAIWEAYGMG